MPNAIVESPGEPLRPALSGGPESLSPEAQKEIRGMMRRDPKRFVLQLVFAWGAVAAAIIVAESIGTIWATAVAVLFIGTRQNILGLLMHEQSHRLAFHSRKGDLLTDAMICWPLFVQLEGYRRVHIAHHQNFFTERDPDYVRKQGTRWRFPQSVWRFLVTVVTDLLGLNSLAVLRSKHQPHAEVARKKSTTFLLRILYYAVIAVGLTLLSGWSVFLIYWVLPLFTVMQVIVRWGAICEHKYDLLDPTMLESTPMIEPNWWERLLLPNLNFTLHVYHHWYPRVPWSKLACVHRIYRKEKRINEANVFHGYGSYLRHLLSPSKRIVSG